jgi:hypothetical protein
MNIISKGYFELRIFFRAAGNFGAIHILQRKIHFGILWILCKLFLITFMSTYEHIHANPIGQQLVHVRAVIPLLTT